MICSNKSRRPESKAKKRVCLSHDYCLRSEDRGKMCEKVKNIPGYEKFSSPVTVWTADEDEKSRWRERTNEEKRAGGKFGRKMSEKFWARESMWEADQEKILRKGDQKCVVVRWDENSQIPTIIKNRVYVFFQEAERKNPLTVGKNAENCTTVIQAKSENDQRKNNETSSTRRKARQYRRNTKLAGFKF